MTDLPTNACIARSRCTAIITLAGQIRDEIGQANPDGGHLLTALRSLEDEVAGLRAELSKYEQEDVAAEMAGFGHGVQITDYTPEEQAVALDQLIADARQQMQTEGTR